MRKLYMLLLAVAMAATATAATVQTPPADLVTEQYIWAGENAVYSGSNTVFAAFTKLISIGFDGEDIYVQGLCTDLPEAWVKGTVNGTTATFATGQYFGSDDRFIAYGYTFPHYFVGYDEQVTDVVFSYDTETRVFTTDTWIIDSEEPSEKNYYIMFKDNVWTPYVEKVGKPANPSFVSVTPTGKYPNVSLSIPLVTTEGDDMNPDKVFYRLFSDIEHQVEQLAFTPEQYRKFTETLYEIPYTLDDYYDIFAGGERVYLNQGNIDTFNRIGLQVVYYGGMDIPSGTQPRTPSEPADNESDIVWYDIMPYMLVNGDVNGDGVLSGADVTALYNTLLDGVEPAGNADVNGDGVISGADVTALYNLLLPQ